MKHWIRITLTILSGILVVPIFPPYGYWPLALVAWIPLFFAIRGATPRMAFYLGLSHGLIAYAGTLLWFTSIFSTAAIALWGMLACFTAGFTLFAAKNPKSSPIVLAILWTGIEYFRAELFTLSFPWITPGTGLSPNWLTPILGVYGVTLVIIFANALIVSEQKKHKITGAAILPLLLLATVTFGASSGNQNKEIKVALIQSESLVGDHYLRESKKLEAPVDAIVWPEYAYGFHPTPYPKDHEKLIQILEKNNSILVTGARRWQDQEEGTWLNSALTFNSAELLGAHTKNHPVHLFDDGEKGKTAKAISTRFGKIGTPICFDCDYEDVIRKMTKDGATFFLVPSMDAVTWSERQHEQHAVLFRHRAAENSRPIAIAATSGVTQILDSHGHVIDRLHHMDEGVLRGTLTPDDSRTLYQIFGWLIGPGTLALGILLIIRNYWTELK